SAPGRTSSTSRSSSAPTTSRSTTEKCASASRKRSADRCRSMPDWLPPLATASFAVLVLNLALLVQRARERSQDWAARFLSELQRWDGRLPDGPDHSSSPHF